MTTPKHTPGPWVGDRNPEADSIYVLTADGSVCIADCATELGPIDLAEVYANAQLIAAAPELLVALQDILDSEESTLGDGGSILGDHFRTIAQAAIARTAECGMTEKERNKRK